MTDQAGLSPDEALAELSQRDVAEFRVLVERIRLHEGPFGTVTPAEVMDDGTTVLGFVSPGPLVRRSVQWLHSNGLLEPSFAGLADVTVSQVQAGGDFGAASAQLDVDTVLSLITKVVRADRFCEGALVGAFDNGTMPALLDRLLQLLSEQ